MRIEAAADFADLFEVKDHLTKKGEFYHRIESNRLLLGYRRDQFVRETLIAANVGADIDEHRLNFAVHIEPHGEWTTRLDVAIGLGGIGEHIEEAKYVRGGHRTRSQMKRSLEKLSEALPRLSCEWPSLQVTYSRSLVDLAALRFYPLTLAGQALPAAGLPWFMTIFGRDSMMVSYQALPFASEFAKATLTALAQRQGTRIDDFRDEEPGKIMHEVRFGEMTAFEERPHSPYYGAADVTPFFLILLDEFERWTGNAELVQHWSWKPELHSSGSTPTVIAMVMAMSSTIAATRRRDWKTSAGRTPGTPSCSPMARSRACHGQPARSRATSTMPRCVVRDLLAPSGMIPSLPTA